MPPPLLEGLKHHILTHTHEQDLGYFILFSNFFDTPIFEYGKQISDIFSLFNFYYPRSTAYIIFYCMTSPHFFIFYYDYGQQMSGRIFLCSIAQLHLSLSPYLFWMHVLGTSPLSPHVPNSSRGHCNLFFAILGQISGDKWCSNLNPSKFEDIWGQIKMSLGQNATRHSHPQKMGLPQNVGINWDKLGTSSFVPGQMQLSSILNIVSEGLKHHL